jgi:hypothetical protein
MVLPIRWFVTVLFAVVAVLLDTANLAAPIIARRRGRNVSAVPLLGAISGTLACLFCPLAGSGSLIPIAVLLDVSVIYLAVWLVKAVARRGADPR